MKTYLQKFQAADTEGLAAKRGPTWGGHDWTTPQSDKEECCHHWALEKQPREELTSLSPEVFTGKVDQHLSGVVRKNLSIRRELIWLKDPGSYSALSFFSFRKWKVTLSGVCVFFVWVSVLGSHVMVVPPSGYHLCCMVVRKKKYCCCSVSLSTASSLGCGGLGINRGDKAELPSQKAGYGNPAKVSSRNVIVWSQWCLVAWVCEEGNKYVLTILDSEDSVEVRRMTQSKRLNHAMGHTSPVILTCFFWGF